MTDQPCFSVVIPTHNYGQYVERAIRSVCAQTTPCWELCVIDDGSTDNTGPLAVSLQSEGLNFRYIYQTNRGLSGARNRGIYETRHDWLLFLDADDEMLPGALDLFTNAILENPSSDLIIAGHESIMGSGKVKTARPRTVTEAPLQNLELFLSKKLPIANGACAMHRHVFDHIAYREDLHQTEDLPVFAHVLAWYGIASRESPVVRIHKHEQSRRHDADAARSLNMALENILFDESGLPPEAQKLRPAYRVKRALSLCKLYYRAEAYEDAIRYFYIALRGRPWLVLQPRFLRRYLVSLWKR